MQSGYEQRKNMMQKFYHRLSIFVSLVVGKNSSGTSLESVIVILAEDNVFDKGFSKIFTCGWEAALTLAKWNNVGSALF